MLDKAEEMLLKKRKKMRKKNYLEVQKIVDSDAGQCKKDIKINYLIEN